MEIGDIVQVRIFCTLGIQTSVNVRHWRTTAKAGTGATLAQMLVMLETMGLSAAYKSLIVSDASYAGADAQIIHPVLGVVTQNQAGAGPGETVGDVLPPQTCGLISLYTALGGKANRGRLYIPFPCELDNIASAQPGAAYLAQADVLRSVVAVPLIAVGGAGNTNDMQPVILHRDTMLTTPVTHSVTRNLWATQRRRGYFGRPNAAPFGQWVNAQPVGVSGVNSEGKRERTGRGNGDLSPPT
jgi:hypothetical protein